MTRRRKIDVFWAGYGYSCFWTSEYGIQFYHPNRDRDALHELYGGKNYYTSQSGLTGAGYLLPDPGDILVEFGYYRTDTGAGPGHQEKMQVGSFLKGAPCYEAPIYGYLPIANGGCTDYFPAVLTDGRRIAFVNPFYREPIPEAIQGWNSLPWGEAKKIPFDYYSYNGVASKSQDTFLLLNPEGFRGVNALRFADIRPAQRSTMAFFMDMPSGAARWMNVLSCYTDGNRVCVTDPLFGHITDYFPHHPTQGWPGQINGWDVDTETPGQLFCYRQRGFEIIALAVNLETNRSVEKTFLAVGFNPEKVQKELFLELEELGEKASI